MTVNVKGTLVIPDEFVTLGNDGTKEITLVGEGNGATIDFTNSYLSRIQMKNEAGKLHFKNLTLKNSVRQPDTWDVYDINFYKTSVTFEGVTFAKSISLDPAGNTGFEVSMKNCTITETVTDSYALWICAGANVNLDGCKIDGPRAIKISDEYHKEGALITTLACNDCTFKSTKKAAVLVGSNAGANITFTGTTDITGVTADNVNAVWNDSDYKDYYDKVTVTGATMVQE